MYFKARKKILRFSEAGGEFIYRFCWPAFAVDKSGKIGIFLTCDIFSLDPLK